LAVGRLFFAPIGLCGLSPAARASDKPIPWRETREEGRLLK
jgi:hypothetical protein